MIIETSEYFLLPYPKRDKHSPLEDNQIETARQWNGTPVQVWVGDGFFQYLNDHVEPGEKRPLMGIFSHFLSDYLLLVPWFKRKDISSLDRTSLMALTGTGDAEMPGTLSYYEALLAMSHFGLMIPISEVSMMARNPHLNPFQ